MRETRRTNLFIDGLHKLWTEFAQQSLRHLDVGNAAIHRCRWFRVEVTIADIFEKSAQKPKAFLFVPLEWVL